MESSEEGPADDASDPSPLGGLPLRSLLGYYLFGYAMCVFLLASDVIPPAALVVGSTVKAVLLGLIFLFGWGFLWVYLASKALRGRITFRQSLALSGRALVIPGAAGSLVALALALFAPTEIMKYGAMAFGFAGFGAVGAAASRVNDLGALRGLLFLVWLPVLAVTVVVLAALIS